VSAEKFDLDPSAEKSYFGIWSIGKLEWAVFQLRKRWSHSKIGAGETFLYYKGTKDSIVLSGNRPRKHERILLMLEEY
jgi:hypothetical protein